MSQMKNLNKAAFLIDLVVNQNRAVNEFAYLGALFDSASHAWKTSE